MHAGLSLNTMNGGLYVTSPNNNDASLVSPVKASPTTNGNGIDDSNTSNGVGPLHIPAKRLDTNGRWPPTSNGNGSGGNPNSNGGYPLIDSNDPITTMAVSAAAAAAYPSSHYSSLSAASSAEAVRRATPTGTSSSTSVDTKPGLNFWQNDYHKYSQAAAQAQASANASAAVASASTTSPTSTSATSGGSGSESAAASAAAASAVAAECNAAAGFAAHQSAWNYPHPGQYAAASSLASTTAEQAAAEAARVRQMADSAAGFHTDYTRLQYPPDGLYTHPPGTNPFFSNAYELLSPPPYGALMANDHHITTSSRAQFPILYVGGSFKERRGV